MSLHRRLSDSSQQENSPLLPNSRGRNEGPHGWRDILENKMTWAWYTTVMSSGGVALLIYELPYQVHRLWVVGSIVYIASLIGFLLLLLIHLARFALNPRLIPASIAHPSEGLFVSTFAAALGILIIDGATYSHKMHTSSGSALRTFYWVFVLVAVIFGVATPLAQFSRSTPTHDTRDSAPMSVQQVLPLTLVGYAAAMVASHIDPGTGSYIAMPILYMGIAIQGMGILVSLLYLAGFVDSLYRYSLPVAASRPSMFISVGPPAFTAVSFALLAEQCLRHFPGTRTAPDHAVDIVGGVAMYYISFFIALMFWGLSLWFFLISTFSNLAVLRHMDIGLQQLEMFSLIFPNIGFALATTYISKLLGNPKVLAVTAEILDLVVVGAWAIVMLAMIFGIVTGRIFRG
ncbi:hypothetical protein Q9L58_000909 [Maublancomyces gigas]|uniref:C4-dicarboxylate transporter/malic acid transport protein n=1 Tax=Discina gigas TaxID=1032678 RepID=A0ABR3GVY4_9PEZI